MQHDNSHPTTFSASDNKYPASYIKIVYKALSTKAKIRSYPQRASGAGHHINCTLSINTVSEYCAERISDPLFIHCYSSTHGVHSLSLRVKSPLHFRNGSDTQNQPQPLLILNPSVPNFFYSSSSSSDSNSSSSFSFENLPFLLLPLSPLLPLAWLPDPSSEKWRCQQDVSSDCKLHLYCRRLFLLSSWEKQQSATEVRRGILYAWVRQEEHMIHNRRHFKTTLFPLKTKTARND